MNITFPTREEAKAKGFFFFPKLANAIGIKKYRNLWSGQDQFNFNCYTYKQYPANMRQRLHNELVLEIDDMPVNKILEVMKHYAKILRKKNISYQLFYAGNKSYYLQLYFNISITKEMIIAWLQTVFTKTQIKDFDPVNWDKTRLIGLEGMPHRHGFKLKSEIEIYPENIEDWFVNEYPKDLLIKIKQEEEKREEYLKDYVPTKFTGKCAFLDYYMVHKFKKGAGGHTDIVPNFVIALPDPKLWEKASKTQGKDLTEFENWARDIKEWNKTHEANKQKVFKCSQVRAFAENQNCAEVCKFCPHAKLKLSQEIWDLKKLMARGW